MSRKNLCRDKFLIQLSGLIFLKPVKKHPGSKKRKKTAQLKIHDIIPIPPDHIPEGSVFKGYNPFVVQGLKIQLYNIKYLLETYETPDGKYLCAKLPEYLNGKHFSPELICFILCQHHHCGVTQPLLLEQLHEFGIDISKGQLNNILIENKDRFHKEKDDILSVGLQVSNYINLVYKKSAYRRGNNTFPHIGTGSKYRKARVFFYFSIPTLALTPL